MADEVFRQERKRVTPQEVAKAADAQQGDPLQSVRNVQQAAKQETGREESPAVVTNSPLQIEGNIPPAFRAALERQRAKGVSPEEQVQNIRAASPEGAAPEAIAPIQEEGAIRYKKRQPKMKEAPTPDSKIRLQGSSELEDALARLAEQHQYEEFAFCSRGNFYNNVPPVIHIRPMTGEEEQILATPRFVKKGKAIDMIFNRCIQEPIDTEELLSLDRTHLLIYLRGISYTPEYDVEIKCPECGMKFSTVIDLDQLEVTACPEDFDIKKLEGTLPKSGMYFRYRLATGADEQAVTHYREQRISMFGDQSEDDTLLYRTAILLEEIQGVTNRRELQVLLKRLPIQDVSYLRNEINEPPFGVETEIEVVCPACTNEFDIDLPLEASFFFPRKKEKTPQ